MRPTRRQLCSLVGAMVALRTSPGGSGSRPIGKRMSIEILPTAEEAGEDSRSAFSRQLLVESCLAVAGDMECYDYQIGRLIRKVDQAVTENPAWSSDKPQLLNLVRFAATGFGGRREKVWLASFESSVDPDSPADLEE